MAILRFSDMTLTVDPARGCVTSLTVGADTLLAAESALFRGCIRQPDSSTFEVCSTDATLVSETAANNVLTLSYKGFAGAAADITVTLALNTCDGALNASVAAENHTQNMIEWIEVLPLILPKLRGEGGALNGEVLYPYNEGAIVDSMEMRESSWLTDHNPQYPSMGCYPIFPNMVCSQMMAYLYDGEDGRNALYFGAHDEKRGVKGIDFKAAGDGVEMIFRYYCGVDYGADYEAGFPLVIKPVNGGWEAAAEVYRTWFDENLPKRLTKIADNKNLPDWYEDNPFVISYPVRGIHDMDIPMNPNGLYPYTSGLPLIDEIAEGTDA